MPLATNRRHRHAGRARADGRAQRGHRPSRRQAREHHDPRRRLREGARLRPGRLCTRRHAATRRRTRRSNTMPGTLSARRRTCRRSASTACSRARRRTSSRSASCSTRWRRARGRSWLRRGRRHRRHHRRGPAAAARHASTPPSRRPSTTSCSGCCARVPTLRPTAQEVERARSPRCNARHGRGSPALTRRGTADDRRPRDRSARSCCACTRGVREGRGLIVAVTGEPGIGKTSLVEDFLDELPPAGRAPTIARGRCSERLAGAEAYLPILEALDSLLHRRDGPLARRRR